MAVRVVVEENDHARGFNAGLDTALRLLDVQDALIGERTAAALSRMKAEGLKTGGGVPYGYRLMTDGETLIEDGAEQLTIKAARKLRERGMSYRQIAVTLRDRGLFARNGKRFFATQIQRMLIDDAVQAKQ
jgi:DNA invertase Pin-like site-specific DNA recombinase